MKKINFKKALTRTAGVGLGAVASNVIGQKIAPTMDGRIKGAAKVAVGALLLPMLMKGDFMEHVGDGFIAEGTLQLATNMAPSLVKVGAVNDPGIGAPFAIDEDYVKVHGVGNAYDVSGLGGLDEGISGEAYAMNGLDDMD